MVRQALLKANLTTWVPGQHDLPFDAQCTLSECHMAHTGIDIVVNRSPLWIIRPSTTFMDLAVYSQKFTDSVTSQALAPLSMMNQAHHTRPSTQQVLLGVYNAEILPGQWHTDLLWPPF